MKIPSAGGSTGKRLRVAVNIHLELDLDASQKGSCYKTSLRCRQHRVEGYVKK